MAGSEHLITYKAPKYMSICDSSLDYMDLATFYSMFPGEAGASILNRLDIGVSGVHSAPGPAVCAAVVWYNNEPTFHIEAGVSAYLLSEGRVGEAVVPFINEVEVAAMSVKSAKKLYHIIQHCSSVTGVSLCDERVTHVTDDASGSTVTMTVRTYMELLVHNTTARLDVRMADARRMITMYLKGSKRASIRDIRYLPRAGEMRSVLLWVSAVRSYVDFIESTRRSVIRGGTEPIQLYV